MVSANGQDCKPFSAGPQGPEVDSVTILRAAGSHILTKRWSRNAKGQLKAKNYDNATWFSLSVERVGGLPDLGQVLQRLQTEPQAAIVRGAPFPETDRARCKRLSHGSREGDPPTLFECPRWWLALDLDSIPDPPGTSFIRDPGPCMAQVIQTVLPPEFHPAQAIWQATSSAAIKAGVRGRLWFWLSRRVGNRELRTWFPRARAGAPGSAVDHTLFTPVAVHYTAAPIFDASIVDPMPVRFGVIRGERSVTVPDDLQERAAPKRTAVSAMPSNGDGRRYALGALRREVEQIANETPGGRHVAMNTAAFSLARFLRTGALTRGEIESALIDAAWAAGVNADEDELLRYLSYGLDAGEKKVDGRARLPAA